MKPSLTRRGLSAALVVTSLAGAVVSASGTATAATDSYLRPTSFARTDSRAPNTTITTGDAVVGAYVDGDGRHHVSKSYLTYDVSQLRGKQIVDASFVLRELAANDCATAHATEAWLTTPPRHAPSWHRAPKEILRLTGPTTTGDCPGTYVGWSVEEAVAKAVSEDWDTVTIVVRVARGKQRDLAYGRTYGAGPSLHVRHNLPPNVPTGLHVGNKACGQEPTLVADRNVSLYGDWLSDPDDYWLHARIAYWPVDDPASRVERVTSGGTSLNTTIPEAELADGRSYLWQARAEDEHGGVSAWSETCGFTTDWTRPAVPPTISSTTYPPDGGPPGSGGDGMPGDFTFTANGVQDVVAFEYSGIGMPYGRVEADQPGGSATVSLTPTSDGPLSLTVSSVDRAGNRSDGTTYRFWVRSTAPRVQMPWQVKLGDPLTATFTAVQDNAVTFTYQVGELPEVTIPVGADGTSSVQIEVPGGDPWNHEVRVWSTNADGQRSGVTDQRVYVDPAEPTIEVQPSTVLLDEPVEITFTPNMAGVTSYTYRFDSTDWTTVQAEADGTARVTVAPPGVGGHWIYAASITAAGVRSGYGEGFVEVAPSAPTVTSAEYPAGVVSGAPGTPGTFRFTAPIPNIAEYRYSFQNGQEVAVTPAADGSATVTLTPSRPDFVTLRVYAVSTSGKSTGFTDYALRVNPVPPVVDGVPAAPVAVGTQFDLVFTAQQPGAVEFVYTTTSSSVERVVPIVDGKATMPITAINAYGTGGDSMSIYSRTAGGHRSGSLYVSYRVITD